MFLLAPLDNANYIVSAGADARVLWGCFLDVDNALASIGTAVACSRWSGGSMKPSRSALSPLDQGDAGRGSRITTAVGDDRLAA